jgi:hypothetical protein
MWFISMAGRLRHLVVGLALLLTACLPAPTPEPAQVTVIFDLGGGGSGFSASLYAQEVSSGLTFSKPYSSSSHGMVVLPTSAPLVFNLPAPGVYIFYANLVNAPEDYHYGYTGCPAEVDDCQDELLKALEVQPGGVYEVYIGNRYGERHAPVATPHAPVNVPYEKVSD